MFAAAQDRWRICSKVTSIPAIDIITRSGYCSRAAIEHGRHGETVDTEIGGLRGPVAVSAHQGSSAPVKRWRPPGRASPSAL